MTLRITIIFLIILSISAKAQRSRYQFAHTYFGMETEVLPQTKSFNLINQDGKIEQQKLPTYSSTRILIGGTHFWDHADFYISIPIAEFGLKKQKEVKISTGVLTGFRYFPLKIKPNSLRPYLGLGFGGASYKQSSFIGTGPTQVNHQWYYEGGVSYRHKGNKLFEIGMRYFRDKSYDYPISRTQFNRIVLENFSLLISYKKLFDFTQGYSKESMRKYVESAFEKLKKGKALSTFSIGIGYSATIPLVATEYSKKLPWLNQKTSRNGNIEVGLAYYLNPLDAAIRISYRPLKQLESAYNYSYLTRNHSFALEAFKFIGDYHGFVPFIGPYVSSNTYRILEKDFGEEVSDFRTTKMGYGICFGWDIRLSDVDYLLLRTNLRYTPKFNYTKDHLKFTNRQLEFNFIQLVFYPERFSIYKQKN